MRINIRTFHVITNQANMAFVFIKSQEILYESIFNIISLRYLCTFGCCVFIAREYNLFSEQQVLVTVETGRYRLSTSANRHKFCMNEK